MKLEPNVWFDEVVKTYHLISPHIHHTQLVTCPDLNEELNGRFLFKPESLQITGSFKVRGALSAISRLSKDELKRGVIAYSSGNHAQGVAHAAKVFNTPATVVMPIDAPERKQICKKPYLIISFLNFGRIYFKSLKSLLSTV